jgi:hypothetical protein
MRLCGSTRVERRLYPRPLRKKDSSLPRTCLRQVGSVRNDGEWVHLGSVAALVSQEFFQLGQLGIGQIEIFLRVLQVLCLQRRIALC